MKHDIIRFEGKAYPVRDVYINGFGMRLVAGESLEAALIKDGEYISGEARCIDEQIFFYVKDAAIMHYTDNQIAVFIRKEVA